MLLQNISEGVESLKLQLEIFPLEKKQTKDKKIQHEIVDYLRKGARANVKYAPNRDTFERTTWRK